jgi:2-polyprenyl-6-methoxyphenol hydroxylase-like FAD-dependent oxidoreductase
VIDVVVAGASPNGLMLACELGLAGIRPVLLDSLPGPNPQARGGCRVPFELVSWAK